MTAYRLETSRVEAVSCSTVSAIRWRIALALVVLGCIALGCTTSGGPRLDRRAQTEGLTVHQLDGAGLPLRVYAQAGRHGHDTSPLHVYLEGDGRPWRRETQVARDPHTRRALAFALMRLDRAPSLYLTRPCYHARLRHDACDARFWTSHRYGEAVVASLVAGLRAEHARRGHPGLVLIGHSGGGTLAVLLAERLVRETRAVVTIAANLDVGAWSRLHGYSPLTGSLDPARRAPLPATMLQFHLAGGRDTNVPPALVRAYAEPHADRDVTVYADAGHADGWTAVWPEVLARLQVALTVGPRSWRQ